MRHDVKVIGLFGCDDSEELAQWWRSPSGAIHAGSPSSGPLLMRLGFERYPKGDGNVMPILPVWRDDGPRD